MASPSHLGPVIYDFPGDGLRPGESEGVFISGVGINHQVTVTMTAVPFPVVSSAVSSLSVGDVAITREPVPGSAAQVIYAGTFIKNIGNSPIRTAAVWVSTINR